MRRFRPGKTAGFLVFKTARIRQLKPSVFPLMKTPFLAFSAAFLLCLPAARSSCTKLRCGNATSRSNSFSCKPSPRIRKNLQTPSSEITRLPAAGVGFNRFTALRYFDLQGWNQPAVVSPAANGLQPEVLDLAKQDISPEALSPAQRTTLVDLLSGRIMIEAKFLGKIVYKTGHFLTTF